MEHWLQGIILDISPNRLFKAVRVGEPTETRNHPFLKVKFDNKIPSYFQHKESLGISVSFNRSVVSKIFNYLARHQKTIFQDLFQPPALRSCIRSMWQQLSDHLHQGPKYREHVLFTCQQNFGIIMDACKEYARRRGKRDGPGEEKHCAYRATVFKADLSSYKPPPFLF